MRVSERLAKDKLPRKWGVIPRFRSGTQDRSRLNQIAGLARGPRFAPRALMALAEISIKDDKTDEGVTRWIAWSTCIQKIIFVKSLFPFGDYLQK